ncbi:MAG: PilZ domain-containing protein [Oligoflexia bacterium]|nr:PilZ domain-containing protein [Oligoflexia bacterium]
MLPVFVRGHINLTVRERSQTRNLEFTHQNISLAGVSGLPWEPLSREEQFGAKIEVTVRIPTARPLSFRTLATITREFTTFADHMGLRFHLPAEHARDLAEVIRTEGYFPTEYIRKYPRIPSLPIIRTFPLRALAMPRPDVPFPLSFDVLNLSPNGVLISTESQVSEQFRPGQKLDLLLEPRGWFPMPIRLQGLICRVGEEPNERTGNIVRSFGVKFAKIDEVNRTAFVDLLKDILERFRQIGSEGG